MILWNYYDIMYLFIYDDYYYDLSSDIEINYDPDMIILFKDILFTCW